MGVNFRLKKFAIFKEKGVFQGLNVCEKGEFSKLENADMSSSMVLSEGAGPRSLDCRLPYPLLNACCYKETYQ